MNHARYAHGRSFPLWDSIWSMQRADLGGCAPRVQRVETIDVDMAVRDDLPRD